MAFTGFSTDTISFLKDLASNNNKDWFDEHKPLYEMHLLDPLRQLVGSVGHVAKAIDEQIETAPAVNKTISRIYRDTRFSHDKTPYRTEAWISFRRPKKIWNVVPEFYFYLTPEEFSYGMGFYAAPPDFMERYRYLIDSQPERFRRIIEKYAGNTEYRVNGEEYKKRIANRHGDDFAPWVQKKNLYVGCPRPLGGEFYSAELQTLFAQSMEFNADLYTFLVECAEL